MIATIERAQDWHAEFIATHAREADVTELLASSGSTPLQAMQAGMKDTTNVYTGLLDGVPVCMFGARAFSVLGGMGCAWMIGSRALDGYRVQRALLRISLEVVDALQAEYPRLLYNFVDERNHKAIRWLRWLGFKFAAPIPIGVNGEMFIPFHRSA